jgi:hypothetical protein
MTTAVNVYSVPVERLRAVPGSKNRKLLTAVRKQKGFFQMIDDIAEDFGDDEEVGRPPTCAEAAKQIINGEEMNEAFGYVYGYAYEAICATLGEEVSPGWSSIAGAGDWFERIDKLLKSLSVPVKVTNLLYLGPLFELPPPDDYPGLGWWTDDEITAAAVALEKVPLDRKDPTGALADIRAWIEFARERKGDWLIGVHS